MTNQQEVDFKSIKFFNNFDGLRFIAALLVLFHHAASMMSNNGETFITQLDLFKNGANAVSFFFVLSGFLITYLLLQEQNKKRHVSIRNFYIKRILRIWPLYFLMIIIALFIQPVLIDLLHIPYVMTYDFKETWMYFVFFLPGMVTFYFGGSHLLEPLWSIGVEELFYLFWAPVFKYVHRFIFPILLFVLVAKLVLLQLSHLGYFPPAMAYLIRILQFESMAYGGIGAYLLFNYGKQLLNYARSIQIMKLLFGLAILGFIFFSSALHLLLFKSNSPSDFEVFIKSFLFAGFLFSMALTNKKTWMLSSKPMVYLGEISYGIYMYHLLILTVLILPFQNLQLSPIVQFALFLISSMLITILVAGLSKRFFESYFLNFRKKLLR
jgi:peptidoglycan/LPS O-acetylase OafA/YrhL